jgi:U3 small nucleolar RNA-associated protein 15
MASFLSSTDLRQHPPTSTRTVLSTTSALLAVGGGDGDKDNSNSNTNAAAKGGGGIESHPRLGKWYLRNYGLGPKRDVRLTTRRSAPENRYTRVKFRPGPGGSHAGGSTASVVSELNFGGSGASGTGGSLIVACGPRVSLYGTAKGGSSGGISPLVRALRPGNGSGKKKRRVGNDDDDDDDDDDEGEVDLFGGKGKSSSNKDSDDYDDNDDECTAIDPDRNVPTGGKVATCASYRSDSRLIAIGTEGGGVRICDARSRATLRTFDTTKSSSTTRAIRSVAWMRDGKRVVAGGDDGLVRVWSVSGGGGGGGGRDGSGPEITLRGHGDRVTCVKIASIRRDDDPRRGKRTRNDEKENSAGGDDDNLSPYTQLVISGAYDHTIRVWDIESTNEKGRDRCVSVMNHGDPVQALLILPPVSDFRSRHVDNKGGKSDPLRRLDDLPLLVSVGGTTLKIWNPFNGSCLGAFAIRHAKTITSMCLLDIPDDDDDNEEEESKDKRKRHIVTAGLDGLIRIHSASNTDILAGRLPYLHGMQISEPISALAISSDARRIAIGTTTGTVTVHQRRRSASSRSSTSGGMAGEAKEPRRGTYSYFSRGAHEKSHDPDDYLLMHQKKQRLAEYDVLLRKFRYGDALDAVLAKRQPQAVRDMDFNMQFHAFLFPELILTCFVTYLTFQVIAVIEELGKRRGLIIALSNRDEESLDAIMSFTIRFVDDPQYTPYLLGVAHILCDVYGSLSGQSAVVDELFAKLREKVANECTVQKMLLRLLGQIDYVMTTAEILASEEQDRK